MKRKIGSLALVACLGLTLTGCKGSTNDVEKQIDKIEETIEEGKIFNKDYSINFDFKTTTMGASVAIKGFLVKDGDNFYREDNAGEVSSKTWIIKGDEKYTIYLENATGKHYYTVDLDDTTAIDALLDGDLKEIYKQEVSTLTLSLESCDEDSATCEVEKSLFGKVTYSIEEEGSSAKYVLKGGKILSSEVKLDGGVAVKMETVSEYNYSNQTVKAPNKVEFKELGK